MTLEEIKERWEKMRGELENRNASEEEMMAYYLVYVFDPLMMIEKEDQS